MRNEDRLKRCRIHDLRKIEISLNNGQCRLAQNRIVIINHTGMGYKSIVLLTKKLVKQVEWT